MSHIPSSIDELQSALAREFARKIDGAAVKLSIEFGDLVLTVAPESLYHVLEVCKSSRALQFDLLSDITAVDWLDARETRFEAVYQLLSLPRLWRLTVRVPVSERTPEIASAVPLWPGANFLEREVWDMFGIRFTGHPDLRRILLYEEFVGHPLRKDYPVQAKQPRIALRKPEVENTARHMKRPDLVAIRSRRGSGQDGSELPR